jgi:hypothetical protein
MGLTRITATSGTISGWTYLSTSEGGATPEIQPTIISLNGATMNESLGYASVSFQPFSGTSGEDLVIAGTNLDRVVGIQLDFGSCYETFSWPDVFTNDPNLSTFHMISGTVIVPSSASLVDGNVYGQCSFTIDSPSQITIPALSFRQMCYDFEDPSVMGMTGSAYFQLYDSAISGLARPEWIDVWYEFLNNHNDGEGLLETVLTSNWWVLRLWYVSGSHFIEPPFFFRCEQPPPTYFVSAYTGSLAIEEPWWPPPGV